MNLVEQLSNATFASMFIFFIEPTQSMANGSKSKEVPIPKSGGPGGLRSHDNWRHTSAGREPVTITVQGFDQYLKQRINPRDYNHIYNLAKEYASVLATRNAKPLLTVSAGRRKHAMLALIHLAEYNGCKQVFKEVKDNFGLKWPKKQYEFDLFDKTNINEMLDYIRKVRDLLPQQYANTVIYDTLTGLRVREATKSINFIQTQLKDYLNEDRMVLEHYKFKADFLRKSKNAYISIVTPETIEIAKNASTNYEAMKGMLRHSKIPVNFKFARKIFATYMHDHQIPTEIVDMLQGRVSIGMFGRHYYRPDFNRYAERVRRLIPKLKKELE
jgi:intergrase/recombinase